MIKWKFVLLGISGHLAKTKILQGLSQFASLNEVNVEIDLIGYSRSKVEQGEIEKILNEACEGQHKIKNIELIQGEYTDYAYFDNLFNNSTENEQVVVYMAVPPSTFLEFISKACPYSNKNITILVEKPFGNDLKEAKRILKVMDQCALGAKVKFVDHYLFKTSMILDKGQLMNLSHLKKQHLKSLDIRLLESASVQKRIGYYDKAGAFKDMAPHIFSLLKSTLQYIYGTQINLDFIPEYEVSNIYWGQYKTYQEELDRYSETETYFRIEGHLPTHRQANMQDKVMFSMESGKKLSLKSSTIHLQFVDGSEAIWEIAPEKYLEVKTPEQSLILNLDTNKKLDHTNLFEQLLSLNLESGNFVSLEEVVMSWELYEKVMSVKNFKISRPGVYTDYKYPPRLEEMPIFSYKEDLKEEEPKKDLEEPKLRINNKVQL